jgi:RNA polymerase-binding transcription factor DksA
VNRPSPSPDATPDWGAQLDRQRAEILARIGDLTAQVADFVESASSTTGDDEHDPEGATVGFERAQALALLQQAGDDLAAVDAAARRLAAGSYGRCAGCGGPIGTERLLARPIAEYCITCARRRH